MNKITVLLFALLVGFIGCDLIAGGDRRESLPETTPLMSREGVIMEVFILEKDGNIHFWQESAHGIIAESARHFSHEHINPSDSTAYTTFKVTYCLTGKEVWDEVSYQDAKFIHNVMKQHKEIHAPVILKLDY